MFANGKGVVVRYFGPISVGMTLLGLVLLVLPPLIGLSSSWTLVGMLLLVAGGIKLIVVRLWRGLVHGPGVEHSTAPRD